jgi:hypothetical protein
MPSIDQIKSIVLRWILIVLLAMASCDEGEHSKLLVDIEIAPGTALPEFWLIATNESGEAIQQQQWHGEKHFQLRAPLSTPQKFNLILLFVEYPGKQKKFSIKAFEGLSPGRLWSLGESFNYTAPVGNFELSFNDVPNEDFENIRASQDENILHKTGACSVDGGLVNCNHQFELYATSRPVMFAYTPGNGVPMYFQPDTLTVGKSYIYNFSEVFQPFDHVVEIPRHDEVFVVCDIQGIDSGKQYPQTYYYSGDPGENFKVGYNDGYAKYRAKYDTYFTGRFCSWTVVGSSLNANDFLLPENDFTIVDHSFQDFDFSIQWNKNLEYHRSEWIYFLPNTTGSETIRLELYGREGKGSNVIQAFPSVITNQHPDLLELDKLEHLLSEFTFNNGDVTYEDAIDEIFSVGVPEPRTRYAIFK